MGYPKGPPAQPNRAFSAHSKLVGNAALHRSLAVNRRRPHVTHHGFLRMARSNRGRPARRGAQDGFSQRVRCPIQFVICWLPKIRPIADGRDNSRRFARTTPARTPLHRASVPLTRNSGSSLRSIVMRKIVGSAAYCCGYRRRHAIDAGLGKPTPWYGTSVSMVAIFWFVRRHCGLHVGSLRLGFSNVRVQ